MTITVTSSAITVSTLSVQANNPLQLVAGNDAPVALAANTVVHVPQGPAIIGPVPSYTARMSSVFVSWMCEQHRNIVCIVGV